ncbi:NAF1-domain-containing protein [Xylariaceae sp. FL1651]|nr:NAF1-domain-containing protein [Xylariaceae sp. FL1651]
MSGIQIPGLNTLLTTVGSDNAQPTTVSGEKATIKESQSNTTDTVNSQHVDTEQTKSSDLEQVEDNMVIDRQPSPPSLTSGLEALLGGLDPVPEHASVSVSEPNIMVQNGESHEHEQENAEGEHPEWEEDSSPYESSSDSSSSDDSDDDSEDEKDYQILGPEETARILMEMDGGSDDEGEGKGKGSGSGQVRTKNELPEEVVPRPDVEIKPEMELVELGTIEHFVGNIAVIRANTTGEYQVLDTGSVLCLQDRTVIAAVADVIAAVREPRYTAGFTSEEEIKTFGLQPGTKIFYPPALATLGLTQTIRNIRGTDASNWHDEEVGDDEVEFSDDEKEAEHKRQQKAKKRGARGGRDNAAGRGGRGDATNAIGSTAPTSLKYDDDDEDGPYRPLARPPGFGQVQPAHGGSEPSSGSSGRGNAHRGSRGDFRARGGRGRGGRGNRGGSSRGGYSLPPRPQGQGGQNFQQPPTQQYNVPHASQVQMSGQPYPLFPPQPNSQHQPSNQQFPFPWSQNTQPSFIPPPPPQFTGQQGANGMYFNPHFFAAMQNQVQGQNGQHNSQWPGQAGQQNNQWPGQDSHG